LEDVFVKGDNIEIDAEGGDVTLEWLKLAINKEVSDLETALDVG
jgi:hypothetical protein